MAGHDVERFRVGLNRRLDHIEDGARHKVATSGRVNDEVVRAWRIVRGPLGLPADHPMTPKAQLYARRPKLRGPVTRARAHAFRAGRAKPRMLTARQLGLTFQWLWGSVGLVYRGGGHYSAGARARDGAELVERVRSFHAYHRRWGGCSYNALIADDGTIAFASPVGRKSAQVAGQNTGMVGVCIPGTTGDRITPAAERSLRWLMKNWHTPAVPAEHRLPRPARQLDWRGHKEFPGQSTSCPGDMLPQYKEIFP